MKGRCGCQFKQQTKVYRTRFWMGAYGSPTPKRHLLLSNSKEISGFDTPFKRVLIRAKSSDKLAKTYTDRRGRRRFYGSKKLKASQWGPRSGKCSCSPGSQVELKWHPLSPLLSHGLTCKIKALPATVWNAVRSPLRQPGSPRRGETYSGSEIGFGQALSL